MIHLLAFLLAALPVTSKPEKRPPGAQGMGFAPKIVYLRLAPGEKVELPFHLYTWEAHANHFSVFVNDVAAHPTAPGERRFLSPGSSERGAGKWLVDPQNQRVRVPPDQEVTLTQTVSVPSSATPGTYLAAMMFQLESTENDSGEEVKDHVEVRAGVKMNRIAGIVVHIDVKGPDTPPPAPAVKLANSEVHPPAGGQPLVLRLLLDNPSPWEVKPIGTLIVLKDGRPLGKASFDPEQLWPGQKVWVRASFPSHLAPGRYQGLAALELQDPNEVGTVYPAPPVKFKFDFEVAAAPAASASKSGP